MNSADITLENAQQLVIDESFKRLVVVNVWSARSQPSLELKRVLEKLSEEYQGQFLLANIDGDDQATLASQFGVQSLPTVMMIKEGQPKDGFGEPLPEAQVREKLEQFLPKPWEQNLQRAQELLEAGEYGNALPLLQRVYDEARKPPEVACLIAQALVELNRLEEAEEALAAVKLADQGTQYQQVKAQLELKRQAAKTPEVESLEQALSADPDNLDLSYKLALQYNQEGYQRPALELLVKILQRDLGYGEGAARKALTDILAALGKGDPLAIEFQRKLFTLLY